MTAEQAAVLDEREVLDQREVLDEPEELEEDFGADLCDEELGDLLVREVTIDGMCGVY